MEAASAPFSLSLALAKMKAAAAAAAAQAFFEPRAVGFGGVLLCACNVCVSGGSCHADAMDGKIRVNIGSAGEIGYRGVAFAGNSSTSAWSADKCADKWGSTTATDGQIRNEIGTAGKIGYRGFAFAGNSPTSAWSADKCADKWGSTTAMDGQIRDDIGTAGKIGYRGFAFAGNSSTFWSADKEGSTSRSQYKGGSTSRSQYKGGSTSRSQYKARPAAVMRFPFSVSARSYSGAAGTGGGGGGASGTGGGGGASGTGGDRWVTDCGGLPRGPPLPEGVNEMERMLIVLRRLEDIRYDTFKNYAELKHSQLKQAEEMIEMKAVHKEAVASAFKQVGVIGYHTLLAMGAVATLVYCATQFTKTKEDPPTVAMLPAAWASATPPPASTPSPPPAPIPSLLPPPLSRLLPPPFPSSPQSKEASSL